MNQPKTLLSSVMFALAAALGCDGGSPELTQPPAPAEPALTEAADKPAADPHAAHEAAAEAMPAMPSVPAGAKVSFVSPTAGSKVTGPLQDGKVEVDVQMGAAGITVEPAGPVNEGAGHHHILVDLKPIEAGTVVPKDDSHIHFGGGQTEAKIMLAPGSHTLTLQFADGLHRSYGPELSSSTSIEVEAAK